MLMLLLPRQETQAQQQLRQVVTKYADSEVIHERYHVLKYNRQLKHGRYQRFDQASNLVVAGNYNDNKKAGIWVEYYLGNRIKARGNYVKGKKVGIWEYYSPDQVLFEKYNVDNAEVLYLRDDWLQNIENADSLDRVPHFSQGFFTLMEMLKEKIGYPYKPKQLKVEGSATAHFVITEKGQLTDLETTETTGREEDMGFASALENALKQLSKTRWMPGEMDGKRVAVRMSLTYEFELN